MLAVTLIKLGGSLITNKSKPFTVREDILQDVVAQVAKAHKKGTLCILGHGSGSFAHAPAEKYQKGYLEKQSDYGAAVVADAACQLNRIVVSELLKQNIPAITLSPFSSFVANDRKVESSCFNTLDHCLQAALVPVLYGDVIGDTKLKYTIWSTETVLNTIAKEWKSTEYKVEKVIHCGEPDGFIHNGEVVSVITGRNIEELKKSIYATEGFDVTGGMLHKVEESLNLAQEGIDSYIIGGNHGGNLYRCIVGEDFVGTKVTK